MHSLPNLKLCEYCLVPLIKICTGSSLGSFVWYLSVVGKCGELCAVCLF